MQNFVLNSVTQEHWKTNSTGNAKILLHLFKHASERFQKAHLNSTYVQSCNFQPTSNAGGSKYSRLNEWKYKCFITHRTLTKLKERQNTALVKHVLNSQVTYASQCAYSGTWIWCRCSGASFYTCIISYPHYKQNLHLSYFVIPDIMYIYAVT
jgi:hypothetical protein